MTLPWSDIPSLLLYLSSHTNWPWYRMEGDYGSHELQDAGIAGGHLGGWLHQTHRISLLRAPQLLIIQSCYLLPLLIHRSQEPREKRRRKRRGSGGGLEKKKTQREKKKRKFCILFLKSLFVIATLKSRSPLDVILAVSRLINSLCFNVVAYSVPQHFFLPLTVTPNITRRKGILFPQRYKLCQIFPLWH